MKLLIASNNKGKLREFENILKSDKLELLSPGALDIRLDVDETGETFGENARLKARAFCEASGIASAADDSGLCVEALNGEPGVKSARYTGNRSDSDDDRISFLLRRLGDEKNRRAKFISHICVVFPDGRQIDAEGELRGRIAYERKGMGGFGYDSVFIPEGSKKTLAELSRDEKDAISHRRKALDNLRIKLGE